MLISLCVCVIMNSRICGSLTSASLLCAQQEQSFRLCLKWGKRSAPSPQPRTQLSLLSTLYSTPFYFLFASILRQYLFHRVFFYLVMSCSFHCLQFCPFFSLLLCLILFLSFCLSIFLSFYRSVRRSHMDMHRQLLMRKENQISRHNRGEDIAQHSNGA